MDTDENQIYKIKKKKKCHVKCSPEPRVVPGVLIPGESPSDLSWAFCVCNVFVMCL